MSACSTCTSGWPAASSARQASPCRANWATDVCRCRVMPPAPGVVGACNRACTSWAGFTQPAMACQQAAASAGICACASCSGEVGWLQSSVAEPGWAGKPFPPPSTRRSSTPVGAQSCPTCSRRWASSSASRTPARVRRDSTLSSGDTWGANTPAGRADAPAAGSRAWSSTVTCQPRRARLAAVAAPAIPPPITTQGPGGEGAAPPLLGVRCAVPSAG